MLSLKMRAHTPLCRYPLPAALAALAGTLALVLPAAAGAASVSANWAGYVATRPAPTRFRSVSGAWRQPSATCRPGRESDSAVWVGLGGFSETSRGLEQVGTDADCTRSGRPMYSGWFELLPAEPVNLKLAVHPGDEMVASVTVRGHDVTLRIRDLTTGARFSTTRHPRSIDASSAEWIVEAPSACTGKNTCDILPLTDFGQVQFSAASATVDGHTGAITDPRWSATALELQQHSSSRAGGRAGRRVAPTNTLTVASPTASSPPSGSFTVDYQQQSVALEHPGPARLPGFGGGPP